MLNLLRDQLRFTITNQNTSFDIFKRNININTKQQKLIDNKNTTSDFDVFDDNGKMVISSKTVKKSIEDYLTKDHALLIKKINYIRQSNMILLINIFKSIKCLNDSDIQF